MSYDYDARGQLTTVSDPRAGRWHFQYDALGRLLQRTHSTGERRSLAYTPEGFVEKIDIAYPTGGADVFTYADHDVLGNPRTLTTQTRGLPAETTTVAYDARSRVSQVKYRPGTPTVQTHDFQYDLVGNRTKHSLTLAVGGPSHRNYFVNDADELTEIKSQGLLKESFAYDGAGRRINDTVLGTGGVVLTATSYGYDPVGRLVSVARSDSGVPSYSATLEYDALGTRTRRTENGTQTGLYFGEWAEVHGPAPQDKLRLVHGGGIDQILAEVAGPTTAPQVRRLVSDAGANVLRVDAGADRELLTLLNASFEHDLDGNQNPDGWTFDPIQTAHGTVSLDATRAYVAGGRSIKLDVPNVPMSAGDPTTDTSNLKAKQTIAAPAAGTYVLSACFYVESGGPATIKFKNFAGASTTLSGPTGSPGWTCSVSTSISANSGDLLEVTARIPEPGFGRVWVDNIRILDSPPPSGSSTLDPSTLESQRRFESFGALRAGSPQPPPIPSERSFASRQTEGATGLVYMRARHYDPATGRFLQPDPLGLDADQLYAYARSNPYRFWDPSGMRPPPISAESAGGVSPLSQGPGQWLFPSGKTEDLIWYDVVILNGINVEPEEFQARVNARGFPGFYNPTAGLPADVLEAAVQKYYGAIDPYARQFAADLARVQHPMTIIAHSQATITVVNAAQYYGLPAGSTLELRSPAISYPRAQLAAWAAGAELEYDLPYGDAAALWAPSLNPLKLLLAPLDVAFGLPVHTSTDP